MQVLSRFILGLGLFFIGMRLVGENLKQLSSQSFRSLVTEFTHSPWLGSLLGVAFGALMQSATAVTFILVSMVDSGLITLRRSLPVLTWTNVGLTFLVFIVSLNIHPLVAYVVGMAGITMSFAKQPTVRSTAAVLLGVGFLLFGLQTIGEGVAPLQHEAWFTRLIADTLSASLVAFLVGILLAIVVQSNTGATLIIVTFATVGSLTLPTAMMLIYGTNLGAIVLRALLAAGLRGSAVQLVRYEDFFCVIGGVVMVVLFYIETLLGVPLVRAAVAAVAASTNGQLALVFLISNLIPALLLSPVLGVVQQRLARRWPPAPEEEASRPQFLKRQALDDPDTAIDLLVREEARLLGGMARSIAVVRARSADLERVRSTHASLAAQIRAFGVDLTKRHLSPTTSARLTASQNELLLIDYIEEALSEFAQTVARIPRAPAADAFVDQLIDNLDGILETAVAAASTFQEGSIQKLRDSCRSHGDAVEQSRARLAQVPTQAGASSYADLLNLASDFELIIWMFHRLAKLLSEHQAQHAPHASSD